MANIEVMANIINLEIIPLEVLTEPVPPPGSDYDQSTLDNNIDTAIIVAGGKEGDPAIEHYISQSLYNDRAPITGFGGVLSYLGNVTEDLWLGIASEQFNPNQPDGKWLKVGKISPSQIEPGKWYYVYATFPNEPVNWPPNQTLYMIACTDQDWNGNTPPDPTTTWIWGGFSTAPYTRGNVMVFNGSSWDGIGEDIDAAFFTFTETGEPPPNCSDYTNRTDCVAAGCYWWSDGTCHDTPENGDGVPCEDYTTKADCLAANCFWYKKYIWDDEKCHGAEQNMIMDYLPFIIAGVGGGIILVALLSRKRAPAPYYPPPPPGYYPPSHRKIPQY